MNDSSLAERDVELPTRDGSMNTFIVHPAAHGPHPVVFFYMDAVGRRPELHDMARRIASEGYYVILPNLYYRTLREFHMTWSEAGVQEMLGLMATLDNSLAVSDTAALLQYVDADPAAMASRIGAVGYCMSGPFVIAAAAAYAERIHAAASFHGTHLVTDRDDSPHRLAREVKAEMYFGCAEHDRWADKATIAMLGEALEHCEAPHCIEWYPGTQHGFVFPERRAYDEAGARLHWERLLSLLARRLKPAR